MKWKKSLLVLGIILIGSLIFITCAGKTEQERSAAEDHDIVIGFSMDSMVIERWERDKEIFMAKAKELGAKVIIQNANEDNQRQIDQIKSLIDQNVDILVIVPYDKDGLTQVVRQAKKKGIKVIAYDRLIKNADVDLYISFDNFKVGELMAGYLLENVPIGNYIVINGSTYDNNAYLLNDGLHSVLDQNVLKRNINIVDETWAVGWREEIAFDTVEKALENNEKIDAIIGANDRLSEAAIQALAERRLAGDVQVVGQDADLSACQRIVEGTQLMTVYKPIKILAQSAAELAVQIVKGEDIQLAYTIDDGTYTVPFYKCEPIPVTKQNMVETVIEDGFHSLEEVYRNVPKDQWPKT